MVLLRREGYQPSPSMVGRILARLKARGVLREPPRGRIAARRLPRSRPYAVRKPEGYSVMTPGDLIQLDTLDVRPLPGVLLKHYTARDVVSRWDVVEAHSRATANTATVFLDTLLERMPFPIKALQVDGGSEFEAVFERACQERGVRLFVLPPRSPKAQRLCRESPPHPHRGVLRGLRWRSPTGPPQPGSEALGAYLQPRATAPSPRLEDTSRVSYGVPPRRGPDRPTVSYVVNE